MKITIVCVGKLKEKYWVEAIAEYKKRLEKFCKFDIIEVKEEKAPDRASAAEEKQIKDAEGKAILLRIKKGSYVIALDVKGMAATSEELAGRIEELGIKGIADITWIIGGSLGLSDEVLHKADYRLSFSKMTFPHQMMRVILSEQIYRAFKIIKNETYHK